MTENQSKSKDIVDRLESTIAPIPRHVQSQVEKQEKETRAVLLFSTLLREPDSFMFDDKDREMRTVFLSRALMHMIGGISAPILFYTFNPSMLKQRRPLIKTVCLFVAFIGGNAYRVQNYRRELGAALLNKYPL